MNVKKLISSVSAIAIAASAFAGLAVSANAEEANVSAAAFAGFDTAATEDVYTNTPIKMNQIDLSGVGGFKTISTFAFAKFDVSAYSEYTIGTATLSYDVTAGGYNSGMALGTVTDISNDWTADAITVDTAKAYTGSWLFNKNNCEWSTKNATKTISYDVTDSIKNAISDNDGIVTFFLATTTGREQTLDTVPSLKVTYSAKAVAGAVNVSYVADGETIGAPAAQPSVEGLFTGDTVTFAFPAYVKSGDKYYKSTETGFNKTVTLTDAAQNVTVSYVEADKVVDYAEVDVANYGGHNPFAAAADNLNASDGKDGGTVYASGNCYQTFNVPVNGNYNITVNAVGTASKNRSVYLNVDGTDEATRIGTLSCNNGSTAVETVNVDLTAGEHTFYFVGNGGISPILDYMVVELVKEIVPEANLGATIDDQGVENGTEEFANDSATWFIITVANTGDAEGSYNTVSITDGTDTFNADVANATLDAGASIVYGGVVQNAYTFTGASVN